MVEFRKRRFPDFNTKKQLILDAAVELVKSKVFLTRPKTDIAYKLGISPTLINYYFGTIKELLEEVEKIINAQK